MKTQTSASRWLGGLFWFGSASTPPVVAIWFVVSVSLSGFSTRPNINGLEGSCSSRAKVILMAVFVGKEVTEYLPRVWAVCWTRSSTHGSQRFFHCSEAALPLGLGLSEALVFQEMVLIPAKLVSVEVIQPDSQRSNRAFLLGGSRMGWRSRRHGTCVTHSLLYSSLMSFFFGEATHTWEVQMFIFKEAEIRKTIMRH